jgi:hypothetical protein
MHPKVKQALEEIDAAVFNGDTFEDEEARNELLDYISSWKREVGEVDEEDQDDEEA